MNIAKDSTVRTAQGHEKQLRDLPPKTRIYCSQHIDSRPSAVTLRSRKDNPGFFCSTCNATFFLDDGFGSNNYVDEYSFDYNWHKLLEISPREREMYTDETGWIDISDVRGGNIREIDEQYLPFDETTFAGIPVKPSSEMNPMLRDVFDFDEVPATYNVTYVRSPKCVFR